MNFMFFWYDHRMANSARTDPELDGLKDIINLFDAQIVRAIPAGNGIPANCLAFVHPGEHQTDWEAVANPNANRYVVLVSSVQLSSTTDGVYCIKTSLPILAKFLNSNIDKVKSFKKSCEEGNPDWSVFESVVYPDALVACYLAMVANEPTLLEELKEEAEEDFKKLRAKHGCGGAFDREGIKELFQKMADMTLGRQIQRCS